MRKNTKDKFQAYFDKLRELAKKAPTAEKILAEFERGDFSSVDPEFFKTGHDIAEKFLNFRKKKKQQKMKRSKYRERDISL